MITKWFIRHSNDSMGGVYLAWHGAAGFGWVSKGDVRAARFDTKEEAEDYISKSFLGDFAIAEECEVDEVGMAQRDLVG